MKFREMRLSQVYGEMTELRHKPNYSKASIVPTKIT